MVLKGQFLERLVPISSEGGLLLDGLFHRGVRGPACVVAAPHPALGGSMNTPAINEIAWALTRGGHPTLRFDYRGVGASQGQSRHRAADAADALPRIEPEALRDEVADLHAAADQLVASVPGQGFGLCAIGYSFGACVVLEAARTKARRWEKLVLVAPPSALAGLAALEQLELPLLVVCAQHDPWCDRALLQRLVEPHGERARLSVVPHADHGFNRGALELGHTIAEWLRDGRPPLRIDPGGDGEPGVDEAWVDLEDDGSPPLELDE